MNILDTTNVMVWLDDKVTLDMVQKVCDSLKLTIWELNIPEDLLGIPYFFAVIDGKNLTSEILQNLEETVKYENAKEFAILLTQVPDVKIPASIRKYFIFPLEVITHEWLKTNMLNKRFAMMRHVNNHRSYDKKLFRLIYILKNLWKKGSILYINDLCQHFNVSEKTVKRDIDLLRSIGEDIEYDRVRNGYYLAFSIMDIEID